MGAQSGKQCRAGTSQSAGRKNADCLRRHDGVDQSGADYRSPGDNVMRKQIVVGSTVLARLHDEREVQAKVTKIVDSVLGRKVHIAFGASALIFDEVQIIGVSGHDS
jgi:hypothetical protein